MGIKAVVRRVGAAGALVLGLWAWSGGVPAQAAIRPDRPGPGQAAPRPAPDRSALRAAWRYVPPPPPAPAPPPRPTVPAICLERPAIVCVSKRERTLRYFERGGLWLSTPVATGRPGYETPSGLWSVHIKDANAWSYEFNAPMPYSLEYDLARGIYIHYSSTFAAVGPTYIGSHGCVNIGNLTTARTLFERVPLGAAVYVY